MERPRHPRPDLSLGALYRRTGADGPFGDHRRAHGVGLEGYYWRVFEPGWSALAIAGVCRDWAMITLATSSGEVWTELADAPRLSSDGLGVVAGPLRADGSSLRVELGPGLDVRFARRREWPRRFSPLGPAQMVPFLGQYWAPWLLSARAHGTFGSRVIDAHGYAEKNWGAVFARHWWWGQAEFAAFAGGRVHGVAPTAVAVWTDDEVVTLAPPLARTVARAGAGEWSIRASSWRWRVEVTGEAGAPLQLPVPIPRERRLEVRSRHHLLGRLEVTVHKGRRVWFRGESSTAALEDGSTPA